MKTGDYMSRIIEKALKTHKITGAAIALVNGDEKMIRHFGYADKADKIPVRPETLFRIGSITKVFTASAVMQLHEQKKLDIDRPVIDYIPEFTVLSYEPALKPITIRDILCHHSGLPCDNLKNYFTTDPEAFHSVTNYLNKAWMVSPPGRMFYYSNLGYELLGVLISRVTGTPYHRYMEEAVLKPLGMAASGIVLSDAMRARLSKPYQKDKEQVEEDMKGLPEGGICSTAEDMAGFISAMLAGGKALYSDKSTLASMFEIQYPSLPLDMSFKNGLGWFVGRPKIDSAGKSVWHDGGTPHFFSLVVLIPGKNIGICLLTNSTGGSIMNHILADELLQSVMKEKYQIDIPAQERQKSEPVIPENAGDCSGRFFTASGIATVRRSAKHSTIRLPSGRFRLKPFAPDWFNLRLMLFGLIPLKLKALSSLRIGLPEINEEKVLVMEQIGFRSPAGKIFRSLNTSEAWESRVGHYICTGEKNPRLKAFDLLKTREGLCISLKTAKMGKLKLYLDVQNDEQAITVGFGRYTGETIIVEEEGINVFGLIFRK